MRWNIALSPVIPFAWEKHSWRAVPETNGSFTLPETRIRTLNPKATVQYAGAITLYRVRLRFGIRVRARVRLRQCKWAMSHNILQQEPHVFVEFIGLLEEALIFALDAESDEGADDDVSPEPTPRRPLSVL